MHAFVCAELSYCACGGTMDVSLLASVCVQDCVCQTCACNAAVVVNAIHWCPALGTVVDHSSML